MTAKDRRCVFFFDFSVPSLDVNSRNAHHGLFVNFIRPFTTNENGFYLSEDRRVFGFTTVLNSSPDAKFLRQVGRDWNCRQIVVNHESVYPIGSA